MATTNVPTAYMILRRDDDVMFVYREHTTVFNELYCLPAGHVEDMESYSHAAIREAKEEVGVEIDESDVKHVFTLQHVASLEGDHVRTGLFFLAEKFQGEPYNKETRKHGHVKWINISNLPENVMSEQKAVFEAMNYGKKYLEIGFDR